MPRRQKVSRRKKRRRPARRTKRRGGKGPTTAIMRGPTGFPDRVRVKLNYYAIEQYTLTAGAAAYSYFRGNSLYAPRSSGGHQPYGYDQWTTMYNKYRVLGSSIRVVPGWGSTGFTGTTASNDIGVVVVPKVENATPTGEILEQPYARSKTGSHYADNMVVKHYMSTAKMVGVDRRAVQSEDNFAAAYNANPTDVWFWFIYVFPPSVGTDTIYLATNIKLTYYVEFFSRVTESQS